MPEEKNVLVMHFSAPSNAFQALSELKQQPDVIGAAVLERTSDGGLRTADGYSQQLGSGIAIGGLVGALVGILAGPLGVLLGWSTGLLTGALFDADDEADTEDGFTVLSKSIPPGSNALIVEMSETSHAIADDIAAKLDGTVTRIPASEVEKEVAAAQEATRRAAAEARKARWEKRRVEFKERLSNIGHHTKKS
ncbi:MAG TPA: hypothetical protein VFA83_22635 [Acidimicrobiales bacterium]|nr:hypothetical protein [Acidimicrobiales bacterium]